MNGECITGIKTVPRCFDGLNLTLAYDENSVPYVCVIIVCGYVPIIYSMCVQFTLEVKMTKIIVDGESVHLLIFLYIPNWWPPYYTY